MSYNPTQHKVNARYGAPMGRTEYHPQREDSDVQKLNLAQVRINNGGYDTGGAYWGTGQTLYVAWADSDYIEAADKETSPVEIYTRANSREQAKTNLLKVYPFIKFKR